MTTRRAYALLLGGRFLVRTLLRRHPSRYRHTYESLQQVERQRLDELDEEFLGVELPDWMTADAETLTDEQRSFIRGRFYSGSNMTTPMLHRWLYDPRVVDGVNPWRKGIEARRVRTRLRQLKHVRMVARPDGHGWTPAGYDVARESIFVIEALLHPHSIDYESWVVLQNFGHDWTKPTRYQPRRRLPPAVAAKASLALARHEIAGAGRNAAQV